mmetsp:Transcript_12508/g.12281  ORF Transcript_12508/g.12281 Transcript_12508/m.12281 type:complete len:104 (+) Transcript_12508:519-830(+)|eukprot:CAMPEP_0170566298 /NCGR_PEP_ID=MMETSP0211-20121228/79744_1 /TAXON_ID=311385 /ORGANISM="Pseudokeronopsis sp., Strain OXSARD2" /LENGTH=103 /DNA_ID=CAMNT_0010887423 /DNA_START=1878 /DNA_END=2189 /DNA_ORIENTATION=-
MNQLKLCQNSKSFTCLLKEIEEEEKTFNKDQTYNLTVEGGLTNGGTISNMEAVMQGMTERMHKINDGARKSPMVQRSPIKNVGKSMEKNKTAIISYHKSTEKN